METLLWIISGVVLLMALTALKSVWKLKSQVKSLELDMAIIKGRMKDETPPVGAKA